MGNVLTPEWISAWRGMWVGFGFTLLIFSAHLWRSFARTLCALRARRRGAGLRRCRHVAEHPDAGVCRRAARRPARCHLGMDADRAGGDPGGRWARAHLCTGTCAAGAAWVAARLAHSWAQFRRWRWWRWASPSRSWARCKGRWRHSFFTPHAAAWRGTAHPIAFATGVRDAADSRPPPSSFSCSTPTNIWRSSRAGCSAWGAAGSGSASVRCGWRRVRSLRASSPPGSRCSLPNSRAGSANYKQPGSAHRSPIGGV
jgi:hypothetical protein